MSKPVTKRNKLLKNILHFGTAKVYQVLAGVLTTAVTARYLGVESFGMFALLMAILLSLSILPEAGMKNVLVRAIIADMDRGGEYLGGVLIVRLFLFTVIFVPAIITTHLVSDTRTVLFCFYIGSALMYTQLTIGLVNAVFLSYERLELENYLTLLLSSLILLFVFISTRIDSGIAGIFTAHLVAHLIVVTLGLSVLRRKFFKPIFNNDPALWKELITSTFLVGVSRISKSVYNYMDTILLKVFTSAFAVGIYTSGYNIVQKLNFIPAIIAKPLYPILAWFAVNDRDGMKPLFLNTIKLVSAIAIPLSVIIFFSSEWLIALVFGPDFEKAVIVVQLLSPLFYFSFPNILFWFTGLALKLQRFMAIIAVISIAISAILDVILIPRYGYIGPCIASLSAEIFFCMAIMYRIRTELGISAVRIGYTLFKPLIAGAVMIAIVVFTEQFNLVIRLGLSLIGFGICMLAVRAITPGDLGQIRRLLVKRNQMENQMAT